MTLRTVKTGALYVVARQVLTVCASTAFTPIVRRKVDFPDMFDPVTRTPCGGASVMEFGTASASSG